MVTDTPRWMTGQGGVAPLAQSSLRRQPPRVDSTRRSIPGQLCEATDRLTNTASVAIGLDGTCLLLCEDGYREAMVGTVSLYDREGERLHTTYLGASPEYGKATFLARLDREIRAVQGHYPTATLVGVADGAAENWGFLEKYTDQQVLDFYHATSYLAKAAQAAFPRSKANRQAWLDEHCHTLKHKQAAADRVGLRSL